MGHRWIFAVPLLLVASPAAACSFDTDCNVGSKCVKPSGRLVGICVGGLFPGRPQTNDERVSQPQRPINPSDKAQGEQCSFNTECGVGGSCLKSSGSIYGVCLRRFR